MRILNHGTKFISQSPKHEPFNLLGTYLIRRRTHIRRKHYGTRIRLGIKRKYNGRRKRRFR